MRRKDNNSNNSSNNSTNNSTNNSSIRGMMKGIPRNKTHRHPVTEGRGMREGWVLTCWAESRGWNATHGCCHTHPVNMLWISVDGMRKKVVKSLIVYTSIQGPLNPGRGETTRLASTDRR